MKKLYITLLCSVFSLFCQAQQEPMYTQYLFNGLMYNPAYAGSRAWVSASLLYRHQWTQLEGAPKTATFSLHGQPTEKMGLGMNVYNDQLGVNRTTGFNGSYSYKIPLSKKHSLRLGVTGGIIQYNNNWDELNIQDPDDPLFGLNNESFLLPTVGVGAYYYSERFFAGISLPQLMQHRLNKENPDAQAQLLNHMYITFGAIFPVSSSVKLKPAVLMKQVSGRPFQVDANITAIFNDYLWVGATYRSNDGLAVMAEIHPKPQWWFGYAYDYPISDLGPQQIGTHEIFIGFDLFKMDEAIFSPRYF
ncbi:type IX secretion system membrane protein PorP/SprF [Persicobacter psychrovividus]|uniref:Membrane protein n=1 Tax=Persicobacter psychrovividus TaxID=387638 RepID=A0ABM7VDC9_9BACT|nr:membrane protein [Persicobacter psychrovividus]